MRIAGLAAWMWCSLALPARATVTPDVRLLAGHTLSFRAAAMAGTESAVAVLAGIPGAQLMGEKTYLSILWRPFFENAVVKLRAPTAHALYYNPLMDVALLTQWERRDSGYRVVSVRALPGERMAGGRASVSSEPPWLAAEDGLIEALARITAERIAVFARGPTSTSAPDAVADTRAVLRRLAWNAAMRNQRTGNAEPWLPQALAAISEALGTRDAAALTRAAPATDPETAQALAGLPAGFAQGVVLDMVLDFGNEGRLLIGSRPEDGDLYFFVLCRLQGEACRLRRIMMVALSEWP